MRVTNRHNKGTAKHNFREFDTRKSDHIDRNLIEQNKFFFRFKNQLHAISFNKIADYHAKFKAELADIKNSLRNTENKHKFDKLSKAEQIELIFYYRGFKQTIDNQNKRHIATKHYNKVRDVLDYYTNKRTEPTEAILQIGSHEHREQISADLTMRVYKDYINEHNKRYGKNIIIMDSVLHTDEPNAAVHVHERKLFVGHNNHGELCSNKSQALKELGISLPNPNKKESRYNNRLMTYSKQCRELWIECCQKYGLQIELVPSESNKHGQELAKYKSNREAKKLYDLIEKGNQQTLQNQMKSNELQQIEKQIQIKSDKLKQLETQKNNLMEWTAENGEIDKIALDLMYEKYPDLVDDYQSRAKEIIFKDYAQIDESQKFNYDFDTEELEL